MREPENPLCSCPLELQQDAAEARSPSVPRAHDPGESLWLRHGLRACKARRLEPKLAGSAVCDEGGWGVVGRKRCCQTQKCEKMWGDQRCVWHLQSQVGRIARPDIWSEVLESIPRKPPHLSDTPSSLGRRMSYPENQDPYQPHLSERNLSSVKCWPCNCTRRNSTRGWGGGGT